MRLLLLPFSWAYAFVVFCRNKAFDVGLLKSEDVGVPVISVGNMTLGGTGKTPLVEYLVEACLTKGRRIAVVTRGYKRRSRGVLIVSDGRKLLTDAVQGGDEPVQVAKKFPGAIVVVAERRVDAAWTAVHQLRADAIVLDDGFQHRSLHRDLDIVVLDSRRNLFDMPMIPGGERREPLKGISRANLVALSHVDESTGWWQRQDTFNMPVMEYRYGIGWTWDVGSAQRLPAVDLKGKRLFLFSGIGDHRGFVSQMRRAGVDVAGEEEFPDHHRYSKADMKKVLARATREHAEAVLTTEKDAVRLSGNIPAVNELTRTLTLLCAGIEVEIVHGESVLDSMIDLCLKREAVR